MCAMPWRWQAARISPSPPAPTTRWAASVIGWACPTSPRYWPEPVPLAPGPLEAALALLKHSIDQGAAIVAIGPYTNLHLLDQRYPGILAQAKLFLMGGYVYPPRPGYPSWRNQDDFNVQADVPAALHVLRHARPTLIPLAVTAETFLRRANWTTCAAAMP